MSSAPFQFRRGTAAEWNAINPILLAGEMGYERDVPAGPEVSEDTFSYSDPAFGSGAIKIGDGITRWKDLPYLLNALRFSLPSSSDVEFNDIKTGDVMRWSNGKWRNSPEAGASTAHASQHASGGTDPVALAASQITSGVFAPARLGSGTATSSTFLRGDGQWGSVVSTVIDGGSATSGDGVLDGGSATTV